MSVAESPQTLTTAEQFAQLSFDHPVELVQGVIVHMPSPDVVHGTVCLNIGGELRSWARQNKAGITAANDSGVVTERDPDTVRGPDVIFIAGDRLIDGVAPRGVSDVVPNLCVEVLSPSDRWRAVYRKVDEYFERGVEEVWVADPRRRTVEVIRPDEPPLTLTENDELTSPILPGFTCPVRILFEGV
jgi:Uma2 family endonuclease